MEEARESVRLDPGDVGGYENSANISLALQRFDDPKQTLEQAEARIWMTSSCAIACTLWLSFSETIQPWRRNNNGLREGRTSIGALRCKPN